jgi:glycerophosphoryl diester phosphodiesterase
VRGRSCISVGVLEWYEPLRRKKSEEDSCTMNLSLSDPRIRARSRLSTYVARQSLAARTSVVVLVLFTVASVPAHGDFFAVAHRGGRIQGPENTLEVFQLTIDLGVTPWLETDSWESLDGVLMVHHDLDMCRTTNIGTVPGFDCLVPANNPLGRFPWIRDFTLAELKALDVGSWFSPAFAGTSMPTLEEAIAFVDGTGVPLLVEVKYPGQAPIIAEILNRTGLSADNLIIWARQTWAYDEFHSVIPGIRQITGILPLASVTDAFLAQRAAAGDFGIGIQSVGLTQALVDKIHSYGLLIYSLPGVFGGDPLLQQISMGIDTYHSQDEVWWASFLSTHPCIDRVDNDADGFADFEGIDSDFDGIAEVLPDPGCSDRLATSEVTECQDLIDNDGDGFVDLADPGCVTPNSLSEVDPPSPSVPSLSGWGFLLLGLSILRLGFRYIGSPVTVQLPDSG